MRSAHRLPDRLIVRAYVLRGARLWLAMRGLMSMAFMLAEVDPLNLTFKATVSVVLLAIAAGFLDSRRLRERALLGNLGVSPLMLGSFLAVGPVVGETILFLVVGAFR